jgi:GT2 family glycosyltransferase
MIEQGISTRSGRPDIQAIVVTFNSAAHVRACVVSLQANDVRIAVVDNGSRDDTANIIRAEFSDVLLIETGENLGYGKALNIGAVNTTSEFVLLANADTVFPANSVQRLVEFLRDHPRAGVAGPQQLFPDGAWERSYGDVQGIAEAAKALLGVTSILNVLRRRFWRHGPRRPKRVGYVDGAVMMVRRKAFDQIGGFDSDFHYYCEDADFCLRMRKAGWSVFTVPSVNVTHVRGGSSTKVEGYSDRLLQVQARAWCQLIRKHHSPVYMRFYRRLCSLHARKMQLIYRVLELVTPSRFSPRASTMAAAFETWARIWAEMKP